MIKNLCVVILNWRYFECEGFEVDSGMGGVKIMFFRFCKSDKYYYFCTRNMKEFVMRKIIVFLGLLFFSLVSCNQGSIKKSDWEEMGLHGKVKSLKYRIYEDYVDDKTESRENEIKKLLENTGSTLFFDKKGYITEYVDHMGIKVPLIYDYKQRTVTMKYAEDTSFSITKINKYDLQGNKIEEAMGYRNTWTTEEHMLTYNDAKQVVERIIKNGMMVNSKKEEGYLSEKYNYKYDSKGRVVEETFSKYNSFSDKWYMCDVTHYEYNDRGDVSRREIRTFSKGDKLAKIYQFRLDYTYDSRGNFISLIEYLRTDEGEKKMLSLEREIEYY